MYRIRIINTANEFADISGTINGKAFNAKAVQHNGNRIFKIFENNIITKLNNSTFTRGERQSVARFCKKVYIGIIDFNGKLVDKSVKSERQYFEKRISSLEIENEKLRNIKLQLVQLSNKKYMKGTSDAVAFLSFDDNDISNA